MDHMNKWIFSIYEEMGDAISYALSASLQSMWHTHRIASDMYVWGYN